MWSTFYFSALFIRLKLFKMRHSFVSTVTPFHRWCGERHCFLMCCLVPDSLIEMIKLQSPGVLIGFLTVETRRPDARRFFMNFIKKTKTSDIIKTKQY